MREKCFKMYPGQKGSFNNAEMFNLNCVTAHLNHRGPDLEAGPNILKDYSIDPNPMKKF